MKTQIIQLNSSDDFISARDKMSWSQTSRMLLVIPNTGHILRRKLDLNLIKRHANSLGAQVALVTADPEVRYNANLLGITVFNDVRAAQDAHWRTSRETKKTQFIGRNQSALETLLKPKRLQNKTWQSHDMVRVTSFIISLFTILTLAVLILPGAKITFSPQALTQSIILPVTADPSLSVVNHSTSSLPVDTLDVIVEASETMETTETTMIPDKFSSGTIRLKNITDHAVSVPRNTIVTTLGSDPVRFFTTANQILSIAPDKSLDVGIKAQIPGTNGNLPPGSLVAIEGEVGLYLAATNPEPTHGGTDAAVPSPAEHDYELLRSRLIEKLENNALDRFKKQVPDLDVLISPSIKMIEVLEEKLSPELGEPGKRVDLFLRIKFQSQVVREDVIKNLVEPILAGNTPPGYIPIQNTLKLTTATDPIIGEAGMARWSIGVERKLQPLLTFPQIINQIKGLSIHAAEEQLISSLPQAENIQISLSPEWWPRLPFLSMRINVIQMDPK